MKKLFSFATMFLLVFTLTGCINDNNEGMSEITFTFTDQFGVSNTDSIIYESDFEGTFIELMETEFQVNYEITDCGTLLLGIESLNSKTGAFLAILKNGKMATVGIDDLEYSDGDSFEFQFTWWDPLQENLDNIIRLFLDNHAADYVNETSVEYNVLLALHLLGISDEYVSDGELQAIVDDMVLETVTDYFKAIMLLSVANIDVEQLIVDLNEIATPESYGRTAYAMLGLESNNSTTDISVFISEALADLRINTPYSLGLDSGGISLVALSGDYEGVSELISEYTDWISADQLDTGGIKTRDMLWGPGNENSPSISRVILGLIANDIDPTGPDFTKATNNLVSRLLEFSTSTGSFDFVLDDESTEDLIFSTPQAFLALVAYQVFANTHSAVNPYNFK